MTAGWADDAKRVPVGSDSLFFAASTAKGIVSATTHCLLERGDLAEDLRLAEVWPGFEAMGKADVSLRHVLDHTAGVPAPPAATTVAELCDWDYRCSARAASEPWWKAGTGSSVERMLTNLIENADRFTPDGMPVEIDVTESPPTLRVTDHGPGIPLEELPHVFDRYYRTDRGSGHGIGLAIVKQVADAHGSIQIKSPPNNRPTGTRFVMQFMKKRGPSR